MSRKRVLITCSAKGGLPYYWFSTYDQLLRNPQTEFEFEFAVESGNNAINLSRNIAAQFAIEAGYWKLVQIDADQFWNVDQLLRLIRHDEHIVALPYCKKKPGPVTWLMVKTPNAQIRADGLLPCDFMGTGMFSTSVECLKEMCRKLPERLFLYEDDDGKTKTMTELFPIGLVGPNTAAGRMARVKKLLDDPFADPATLRIKLAEIIHNTDPQAARLLGEDYHFCHLARKCGFKLYCDTKYIVGHVGDIVYPVTEEMKSTPVPIPTHTLSLDDW